MEESNNKKYRIGTVAVMILISIAAIADLITLIPGLGNIIGWIFWFGVACYLWKSGHGWINWRILAPEIISLAAEFLPGIQALPTILASIIAIIVLSRLQDKTGVSLMPTGKSLNTEGVRRPTGTTKPLNSGGMRLPEGGLVGK